MLKLILALVVSQSWAFSLIPKKEKYTRSTSSLEECLPVRLSQFMATQFSYKAGDWIQLQLIRPVVSSNNTVNSKFNKMTLMFDKKMIQSFFGSWDEAYKAFSNLNNNLEKDAKQFGSFCLQEDTPQLLKATVPVQLDNRKIEVKAEFELARQK